MALPLKILVSGDRNWTDRLLMESVLRQYFETQSCILIHGAARGADSMAETIAKKYLVTILSYPAQWETYGKKAGILRNAQMLSEHPDIEIALFFHYNIATSKGTKDMLQRAQKSGILCRAFPQQPNYN